MNEEETVERIRRIANVDENTEPSFSYHGFQVWAKALLVGLFLALIIAHVQYTDATGLGSHLRTIVITLLTVNAWKSIEPYADIGVKAGLIAEEEEQNLDYKRNEEKEEEE